MKTKSIILFLSIIIIINCIFVPQTASWRNLNLKLRDIKNNEKIEVDFKGISTFSPSWGDEFLTPLWNKYRDKLVLKITSNLSVIATIEMIEAIHKKKFKIKKNI